MSAATTMSAYKSPSHSHSHSHSRSHSHTRSSQMRPSATPRTPAPLSASKAMSPSLTPHAHAQQTTKQPRSPSPSYFGLLVGGDSNSLGSSAGQYARLNWEKGSSSVAPAPRTVPLQSNHELDAFQRQSETKTFSLSQGTLSSFARPSQTRQSTNSNTESLVPPRTSHVSHNTSNDDTKRQKQGKDGRTEDGQQSYFDVPRHNSPGSMSPRQLA